MQQPSHAMKQAIPRQVGYLAVALLLSMLWGKSARAGCGDYVHVGGKTLAAGGSVGDLNGPAGHEIPHHAPCTGPSCSNPPAPAPVPTLPKLIDSEEWAICRTGYSQQQAAQAAIAETVSDGARDGYPASVFEPPRRLAA